MGKVILYLRETLQMELTKVYYMSDGCAAQYKNKKSVANVWFHEKDFGVPAEWHYYATSHGKSACDGLGGSVKHKARLHSLRASEPGEQITTPEALYNFAKANMTGMDFVFVPSSAIQEHEKKMEIRFQTAINIDGIKSHHAIVPRRNQPSVMIKVTSNSDNYLEREISTKESKLEFNDVKGFVLFSCDKKSLHLGNVSSCFLPDETFSVQMLNPVPNKTLTYEFSDRIVDIFLEDIISIVSPYFQNKGRFVKLYAKDMKAAEVQLAQR
ncbi:Leucine zipper transcription factor-like protein 1 [Frankliniella fusca]|uniref:Leucine zipper transcription factor-like protein 1 n=1 Tax=Frankliniella fusca TaxID=407009 RepID=A0AAE1GW88_9NEOP|nr:Leucine zipper transcription factor-like protein 1 [Frankliniella fusca]